MQCLFGLIEISLILFSLNSTRDIHNLDYVNISAPTDTCNLVNDTS